MPVVKSPSRQEGSLAGWAVPNSYRAVPFEALGFGHTDFAGGIRSAELNYLHGTNSTEKNAYGDCAFREALTSFRISHKRLEPAHFLGICSVESRPRS
jgi:hypothetical protein